MSRRAVAVSALAASAVLALSACGAGGLPVETATGVVNRLGPAYVCLGDESAPLVGVCYGSTPDLVDGLRVGQCVTITATVVRGRVTNRTATAIEQADDATCASAAPQG